MNEGGQKEGSVGAICPLPHGSAFGAVFCRMPLGPSGLLSSRGRPGGAGKPLSSEQQLLPLGMGLGVVSAA